MDIQKAIEVINGIDLGDVGFSNTSQLIEAIEAREILSEHAKKQIPQKPINPDEDYGTFDCPNCGSTIYTSDALKDHKYCLSCGQAIDWNAAIFQRE